MAPSPIVDTVAVLGTRDVSDELRSINSVPLAGQIISVILAVSSVAIISAFLTQRSLAVKQWRRLPWVQWLVFAIYADSFLFVFATAILQFGFGVDQSIYICQSAILLCLVCYVTTKLIYLFLVEKAYIIRSTCKKPRMRSKLYLFNSVGMMGIYTGVVVLNFMHRVAKLENGQCIIGMKKLAMIPLIAFDLIVNIYLTILFLIPLSSLHSFKNMQQTKGNRRLRTVAKRTFIGSVCTLISSIVNLTVLMALDGEPGWVCLMCCNSDILFSAIVIQWVTSRDSTSHNDSFSASHGGTHAGDELGHIRSSRTRHRTSHTSDAANITSARASADSRCSRKILSSTEAIVEDVAEISIDDLDNAGARSHSPISTSGPFADDKKILGASVVASTMDDEDKPGHTEKDVAIQLPRVPPQSRSAGGTTGKHMPSASEVLVHVDYGASLSREGTAEGVILGNSIVIGTGAGAGAGARGGNGREGSQGAGGRRPHWKIGEGGVL
ncbi:hypothetical protein QBC34DRAFT_104860 [Podospora aff. communis PSN243]|uniref:Uncharacterized protein n=1 Tax=Podospora aff. communis PSN243 TaxID=3040156 RepID=A0AAV9H2R1_9PEZI|nr:hypothetical protein QBC34DRAFT_104860 [Podospora aff. communis PSN243]